MTNMYVYLKLSLCLFPYQGIIPRVFSIIIQCVTQTNTGASSNVNTVKLVTMTTHAFHSSIPAKHGSCPIQEKQT